MAINVTVPLEKLKDPSVSRALSRLMLALGDGLAPGEAGEASKETKARTRGKSQPPAKSDKGGSKGSKRAKGRSKSKSKSSASKSSASKSSETMTFKEFVEQLPDNSRAFLELLQKQGTLTISKAMDELGLDKAKSLGGITGSISRWAPARGVEIPFEAGNTDSGERMWRWTHKKKR